MNKESTKKVKDTLDYRKEVMGLLPLDTTEKRIEAVKKLLYDLGHNWENKNLTYLGCFRGKDFYIDGDVIDAELFQKYMDRVQEEIRAFEKLVQV